MDENTPEINLESWLARHTLDGTMKLFIGLLLLTTLAVLLTGCDVISTYPLSNPQDAKPDPRLLGRWHYRDENKEIYLRFESAPNNWTRVIVEGKDTGSTLPDGSSQMFPTRLDDYDYMNLKPTDPAYENKGYVFVRYSLEGKSLTLWIIDSEKVKERIASGKIIGRIGRAFATTEITDNTKKIREFINSSKDNDIFEYFAQFEKTN